MTLKKNEKILLAVLGAIVVIGGIYTIVDSGNKPDPKTNKQSLVAETKANIINQIKSEIKTESVPVNKVRFETWGRDPFKDQFKRNRDEDEDISNLIVKGIIRKGNQYHVMINDIILTEGEEKDGLYIERIEDNQVFCKKSGKWFTLTWKEEP
ncbi:hypothetical protein ACFL4L_05180 [bacterium]